MYEATPTAHDSMKNIATPRHRQHRHRDRGLRDGADVSTANISIEGVQISDLFRGDLESQLSACATGATGLLTLAHKHGRDELLDLFDQLLDYSETMLRAALAEVDHGEYSFVDHLDDGLTPEPVTFKVRAVRFEEGPLFDFAGTSGQVRSALNATASVST